MGQRSFDSLTDAGRRVRIARDVLKQLDERRVTATPGTYLSVKTVEVKPESSMRTCLRKAKKCSACALGALFVSSVTVKNHVTPKELGLFVDVDEDEDGDLLSEGETAISGGHGDMTARLEDFFSADQLELIESAFECNNMRRGGSLDYAEMMRGIRFGERHRSPRARMAAIMRNIVENRGEFRP